MLTCGRSSDIVEQLGEHFERVPGRVEGFASHAATAALSDTGIAAIERFGRIVCTAVKAIGKNQ